MHSMYFKTLYPSGGTQVSLARAAWVQIRQVSLLEQVPILSFGCASLVLFPSLGFSLLLFVVSATSAKLKVSAKVM